MNTKARGVLLGFFLFIAVLMWHSLEPHEGTSTAHEPSEAGPIQGSEWADKSRARHYSQLLSDIKTKIAERQHLQVLLQEYDAKQHDFQLVAEQVRIARQSALAEVREAENFDELSADTMQELDKANQRESAAHEALRVTFNKLKNEGSK